jgi:hypothetical protein
MTPMRRDAIQGLAFCALFPIPWSLSSLCIDARNTGVGYCL